MIHHFSEALLERCSDFVATEMGLNFPKQRWPDLENGLRAAARDFGFPDVDACLQWLLSARLRKNQVEILARTLTVGETYFYRDKRSFEFLETRVLPELAGRRRDRDRHLRLWSAGCCTGEEAYSLAMAVCRAIPDWKDWSPTIPAPGDVFLSQPRGRYVSLLGDRHERHGRDLLPQCADVFQTGTCRTGGAQSPPQPR
jgi:chemotaxis protein methyltransferase CheR